MPSVHGEERGKETHKLRVCVYDLLDAFSRERLLSEPSLD